MNRPSKLILLMLPKPVRIRLACDWQPMAFTPKLRVAPATNNSPPARLLLRRACGYTVKFNPTGWRR
jgi:hypothetical protein